jgi:hypothetical protein
VKRDLQLLSVHDQDLATRTDYVGGNALDAPGRHTEDWREEAVAAVAGQFGELGWLVRRGELSNDGGPGGIFSIGSEVVGSLWATRYGREVPLVVRVDDCGGIYARLAEPGNVLGLGPDEPLQIPAVGEGQSTPHESTEPILLGDALDRITARQGSDHGLGLDL